MKVMKQTFSIPEEKECRVWHKYMLSTYDLLSKLDESIQDAGLYTNQVCACVQMCSCVYYVYFVLCAHVCGLPCVYTIDVLIVGLVLQYTSAAKSWHPCRPCRLMFSVQAKTGFSVLSYIVPTFINVTLMSILVNWSPLV